MMFAHSDEMQKVLLDSLEKGHPIRGKQTNKSFVDYYRAIVVIMSLTRPLGPLKLRGPCLSPEGFGQGK